MSSKELRQRISRFNSSRWFLPALYLIISGVAAYAEQPLTVCQLLSQLDDLNGKQVSVRGSWGMGDTGEILLSTGPCEQRTVRDGWIWPDAIQVVGGMSNKEYWRLGARIREAGSRTPTRIVATLTGRLETRPHFSVRYGRPVAFKGLVALLHYQKAEDLQIVPYGPGEFEWTDEFSRNPFARRVKRGSK
jgi:hypothetical protein